MYNGRNYHRSHDPTMHCIISSIPCSCVVPQSNFRLAKHTSGAISPLEASVMSHSHPPNLRDSLPNSVWSQTLFVWRCSGSQSFEVKPRPDRKMWKICSKNVAGVGDAKTVKKGFISLRRRFNLFYSVSMVGCLIIGSGIYVGPTGVLKRIASPGLALILWGFVGFVSLIDSLVYAELGTTFPRCGSSYLYHELFYGQWVGFLTLWRYFLITRPGANALKCLLAAM